MTPKVSKRVSRTQGARKGSSDRPHVPMRGTLRRARGATGCTASPPPTPASAPPPPPRSGLCARPHHCPRPRRPPSLLLQNGVHPGKAGHHLEGKFAFSWGGKELTAPQYQTLTVAPEAAGVRGEPAVISGDMTRPCLAPLRSLEELLAWAPGRDPFHVASVPFAEGVRATHGRKLLVCHDMQGGYTAGDRHAQGGGTEHAYRLQRWDLCDLFVYFRYAPRVICSDVPPASASSDMIRWSRILLSHTPDATHSY